MSFAAKGLIVSLLGMALVVASQQIGERTVAKMAETKPVVLKPLAKYHGEHGYTARERRDLAEVIASMDTHEDYVTTLERTLW